MLILPNGKRISQAAVLKAVDIYEPAVFRLYDLPDYGPHDEVKPVDLLSLNALNVWGSGQPMTAMASAWNSRKKIARMVAPVSRKPLEQLSDRQLDEEAKKVEAAIEAIDAIRGFGWTASTKLFHRMRPNLGPIWDRRVRVWYDVKVDWATWVKQVYRDVLRPGTNACLVAARSRLGVRISLLRVWDVLLWAMPHD